MIFNSIQFSYSINRNWFSCKPLYGCNVKFTLERRTAVSLFWHIRCGWDGIFAKKAVKGFPYLKPRTHGNVFDCKFFGDTRKQ